MGHKLFNLPGHQCRDALSGKFGEAVENSCALAMCRCERSRYQGVARQPAAHSFFEPVGSREQGIQGCTLMAWPAFAFKPELDFDHQSCAIFVRSNLVLGLNPCGSPNPRLFRNGFRERGSRSPAERSNRMGQEVDQATNVERCPAHLQGQTQCL